VVLLPPPLHLLLTSVMMDYFYRERVEKLVRRMKKMISKKMGNISK
jgi:hypothetical protein